MEQFIHGKGQAALNVCGCGRLHFTYGPITLHFEREEFAKFAGEVGRLAVMLDQLTADRGPVLFSGQDAPVCH
jgi:hypothetical protein